MSGPGCAECRGLLAVQAIGRASVAEEQAVASHLAGCPQCRQDAEEVGSAARALTLLDAAQVERLSGGPWSSSTDGQDADRQPSGDATAVPLPDRSEAASKGSRRTRGWQVATAAAAVAVAAGVVGLVLSAPPTPPNRAVALRGEAGVVASVSLSPQSWGTRATLRESGQSGGQELSVSMKTSSGRWWVAGSYRTTGGPGTVAVQLSCAAPASQITDVWVSDQHGHTVLNGYVG